MQACWHNIDSGATVLRMRLQPLTLAHVQLLADCGSPFVTGAESQDPIGDLALAVFICSQDPKEARASLTKWWAKHFFRLWFRFCRKLSLQDEAERFVEWLGSEIAGPRIVTTGSGRKMSAPWWVNLLASCVGELGLSIGESEAMPVRKARQLVCAVAEARGQIELETEESESFGAAVKRWEAERRQLGMTIEQYREFATNRATEARN